MLKYVIKRSKLVLMLYLLFLIGKQGYKKVHPTNAFEG